MTPDIIIKLKQELKVGITTEVQVVYLMSCIRKILEREPSNKYDHLKFYCDWALHTSMDRSFAQKILKLLEEGHKELRQGKDLLELSSDAPPETDFIGLKFEYKSEVTRFLHFLWFRKQLIDFLVQYKLPLFVRYDIDWIEFLHLYGCVIQDCPITLSPKSSGSFDVVHLNVKPQYIHNAETKEDRYILAVEVTDVDGTKGVVYTDNRIFP